MRKVIVAYIPVLHRGYTDFLDSLDSPLFLVGEKMLNTLAEEKPYYGREIRLVNPETMQTVIESLELAPSVDVLTPSKAQDLNSEDTTVLAPDEDISHDIVEKFLPAVSADFQSVFLRWNKKITEDEQEISPEETVSRSNFDKKVMNKAFVEAEASSDWWRQVGSVLIKGGEIIMKSHNQHLPSEHSPYAMGDPRNNYDAGERTDLTTAIHSEANLIAKAAKGGIPLQGAEIYVTTFPCPSCAKLIAQSGIKKVYFSEGYSLLDAEDIFDSYDISVVRVVEEE